MKPYDLIVIGGGAAGFFGAIQAAENGKDLRILILEKTTKLLAKVKVSGGGRCNVTHHCFTPAALAHHYPRGQKQLKNLFYQFSAADTVSWFEKHSVPLKTEADGRMFPITDNSQTIIDCFMKSAKEYGIEIKVGQDVTKLASESGLFVVHSSGGVHTAKKVLIATGGYNKSESYQWLVDLGHELVAPIPSLFTFNDPAKEFVALMGVAVPNAQVRIAGTKFLQAGAVLITHWGLSGPAVIKLSAWAAEYLHQQSYRFTTLLNWTGLSEAQVRETLMQLKSESGKKGIFSSPQFDLPRRLWEFLCTKSEIDPGKTWSEMPNKQINKLIEFLYACPFNIQGKTTFKEEFVTCGGIALSNLDLKTMESKKVPGLFFAGEVLNVDGETGGFNFQAAWTTAWVASHSILQSLHVQ